MTFLQSFNQNVKSVNVIICLLLSVWLGKKCHAYCTTLTLMWSLLMYNLINCMCTKTVWHYYSRLTKMLIRLMLSFAIVFNNCFGKKFNAYFTTVTLMWSLLMYNLINCMCTKTVWHYYSRLTKMLIRLML